MRNVIKKISFCITTVLLIISIGTVVLCALTELSDLELIEKIPETSDISEADAELVPYYAYVYAEEKYAVGTEPTEDESGFPYLTESKSTEDSHIKVRGGDLYCEHSFENWTEETAAEIGKAGKSVAYCEICGALGTKSTDPLPDPEARFQLDVEPIMQFPDYPNGCEIVSLTTALRYYGFDVTTDELIDGFFTQSDFSYYNNPFYTYIGDVRTQHSMGCYAPCIVDTANKYLESVGSKLKAYEISGATFEQMTDYIDRGIPVIIWGTTFMSCDETVFCTFDDGYGYPVYWFASSHCLVMTGHAKNTYIFADPMAGCADYDRDDVEQSYDLEYCQACVIY